MSIITKTVKKGGTLTSPSGGMTLSDSTGAFGVKRNDTDAVVVADGTAMTEVSEGVYQYEFTDPANDLIYTIAFELVEESQTLRFQDTAFPGPTTASDGYTIAEFLTKIELARGIAAGSSTAVQTTQAYQALTAAGQAAASWDGTDWWWLHDTGEFSGVVGTGKYALRIVNGSDMSDLHSIEAVYFDDDRLLHNITILEWRAWNRIINPTDTNAEPTSYAVSDEPPNIYLAPTPSTTDSIYVDYIKHHPKISSSSADSKLIIPFEFQTGIYFSGAMYLLREDIGTSPSLKDCPGFIEAIERMYAADPTGYDQRPENQFPDARTGYLPHNQRVIGYSDGYLTQNTVTL